MSVYIIAEAGVNHNGSLAAAKKMVEEAHSAGCDCIKFQTFCADRLVTRTAAKADYQIKQTGGQESQYQMLKKLELSGQEFAALKDYCREVGIDFLSTPFDEESADLLRELGMTQFKIPSGEITNKPLIQHIARFGGKMLMSTGMSDLDEVTEAVNWIRETGNRDIVLFHCTSNYPAPYEHVNMRSMHTLQECFHLPVGYSDHTQGIEISLMAVAMGAVMIEKHFTLDRHMEGPDHQASLEPAELRELVRGIRHIEAAFGDGEKKPAPGEEKTRAVARKSLVYSRDLAEGTVITEKMIACKRPGTGLPPRWRDALVGKALCRACCQEKMVQLSDFSGGGADISDKGKDERG